jgi:8-oxo-dGTP pyrophosphatase MutT (NUDIX family)
VLVPVYDLGGELHVIFTKRTDRVNSHKGEVSFPGGAMDDTDPDLRYTALRESMEEIGLQPGHVSVIGQVDDIVTISDFLVSAFVGEVDPALAPYAWNPHEVEVAEILEVPMSHLLDPANYVEVPRQRNGELLMQPGVRFGEHIIWGATWRMLRNFLDVAVVPEGQTVG